MKTMIFVYCLAITSVHNGKQVTDSVAYAEVTMQDCEVRRAQDLEAMKMNAKYAVTYASKCTAVMLPTKG